jgi:hypothetical protein
MRIDTKSKWISIANAKITCFEVIQNQDEDGWNSISLPFTKKAEAIREKKREVRNNHDKPKRLAIATIKLDIAGADEVFNCDYCHNDLESKEHKLFCEYGNKFDNYEKTLSRHL